MPTYDYQCRDCGNVTEVIHPMREDGPSVCELCGGSLRRVLFPTGIIFKGPGFYRNDSRAARSSGGSDGASTKPVTPATEGTSGKSGESKADKGTSGSTTPTASGES